MLAYIFLSIFVTIYAIGIIYVVVHREKYDIETNFLINMLLYFIFEGIYIFSFILSAEKSFNVFSASALWYISILARILSIGHFSSLHNIELVKDKKIKLVSVMSYIFMYGVIISLLFHPNSFVLVETDLEYYFSFENAGLLISIIIFNALIIIFTWIIQISGYKNFADKELGKFFTFFFIPFSLSILFYTLTIITLSIYIKVIHLVFYNLSIGYYIYILIKKPNLFIVFTNKIYDFIIFHKSGILLYSFNFQTREEVDENLLKGSILIGVNHILANLSNVENQVTHIKMKDRGVIFSFNTQLGFVALLIAKHKNKILESAVDKFMLDFSKLNEENLQNLDRLIDVSKFKNANELIIKNFGHYLTEA
jgi:hypothetical protein